MRLVQDFLRNGGTLQHLKDRYAVGHNRHGQHPHLVQLKYSMIDSPMGEPIVQECRGIILDEGEAWKCVAFPYVKFFNHGEGHAAPIDWATAKVQEKLDGSLIICYPYRGEWQVASSGMPDAGGEVNGCGFTFAELFRRVMEERGYELPRNPNQTGHYTLMFELTTPYNRVVVRHEGNDVRLIGVRSHVTWREVDVNSWRRTSAYNLPPPVRSFPLGSFDEVLATFAGMEPLRQEGYVVLDGAFNRVKVKHPGYVALHHLRDGMGPKRLLEVVRSGESSEFLTYYPEWRVPFEDVKQRFDGLATEMETSFQFYNKIPVQKDFALAIKHVPFTGALFALRAGKTPSIRRWLAEANIKHLVEQLKIKDVEF